MCPSYICWLILVLYLIIMRRASVCWPWAGTCCRCSHGRTSTQTHRRDPCTFLRWHTATTRTRCTLTHIARPYTLDIINSWNYTGRYNIIFFFLSLTIYFIAVWKSFSRLLVYAGLGVKYGIDWNSTYFWVLHISMCENHIITSWNSELLTNWNLSFSV